VVTPLGTTKLELNGNKTSDPVTVEDVTRDIKVRLKEGEDEFTIKDATVPRHLDIKNDEGHNENFVENVIITNNLKVTKTAGTTGKSELHVEDSTIVGNTDVQNDGGDGESETEIKNSTLSGKLTIENNDGEDINKIIGSEITKKVTIKNGKGGSRTTFTFYDPTPDPQNPGDEVGNTLHDELEIVNGDETDEVTLNMTDVDKKVTIKNGNDRSEILITNDTQLKDELEVSNDEGFDSFVMNNSKVEKHVAITNNGTTATFLGGSTTEIQFSTIGTATSPGNLTIKNDDKEDIIRVLDSEVFGKIDIALQKGGVSEVELARNQTIGGLDFESEEGNETLRIEDSTITEETDIKLGPGDDFLNLKGTTKFLKKAKFDGEGGDDDFHLDGGVDFNGIPYDKANFEHDV